MISALLDPIFICSKEPIEAFKSYQHIVTMVAENGAVGLSKGFVKVILEEVKW